MRRLFFAGTCLALFAAAGPCSATLSDSVHDLSRDINDVHRDARDTAKDVVDVQSAAEELERCDRLRTQEVAFQEERQVGQVAALNLASHSGLVIGRSAADPASAPTRYLNRVGFVLAQRSDRPDLPWSFGILADDGVNAFSTPGGYVFVTRGLLKHVQNEAQLAGVLAHEIAHVTYRHALGPYRQIKQSACRNAFAAKKAGKIAGPVFATWERATGSDTGYVDFSSNPELLGQLAQAYTVELARTEFEPSQESQADRDAARLLIAAGYQPREYLKVLASLPAGFQEGSHPPPEARVASVKHAIEGFEKASIDPFTAPGAPFGPDQGFRAPPLGQEVRGL